MPWKIKARLSGLEAAIGRLDRLKKAVRNRVLRRAVTAASRVVLRAIKGAETARRSGQLRRSLGMKVKTYASGKVVGVVGPRKGYAATWQGRPIDPVYYAHLVEAGTRPHRLGAGSLLKKGQQRGAGHPGTTAVRFMARGWAGAAAAARAKALALLEQGLAQAA